MMTSEQIKMMLDGVKGLAMNCEVNVLVLKVLDEYRVYLAPEVRLKTRECRYNEVRDAQDITVLVKNVGGELCAWYDASDINGKGTVHSQGKFQVRYG